MIHNGIRRRSFFTRLRPAVLLGVGAAAGFWLGLVEAGQAPPLPILIALGFVILFAVGWLVRARAQRQTLAVWDAYAEREIALARPLVARRRRRELAEGILSRRDFDARPHAQAW